jgi:hypothetical protein
MNISSVHGDGCIKIAEEGCREKRGSSTKCSVFPYISRHCLFIFTTLMHIKYYSMWIYITNLSSSTFNFSSINLLFWSFDPIFLKYINHKNYTALLSQCGACCWWRSWLRHCATSRKVTGSIRDGVIGIFHWHNPSGRTMVDSASNRNGYEEYFFGSKGGRYVWLTTSPPSCADSLEI